MNIILKKCNIQSSHQPRHGFGNRDVHCLALGHINGCKMKKKIKNNNLFAFISRDVIFDNFHMVESCHGHWWPRTIAMTINYRSGQLLMQETTFRVESVAIGSSNHTHGKLAKKTTFCDIHHLAVLISTCWDIMQYDAWEVFKARFGVFTSKYGLVNALGHMLSRSTIGATFRLQSHLSQGRNALRWPIFLSSY